MAKRFFDVLCACLTLILLSPVLLILCLVVRIKMGAPIFFTQPRAGKDGRIFNMIKFRSMLNTVDENGNPLPDSVRLTPFGKMLRSTSLDELPEILNVIKGDMSLVGPRPLLVKYLPLYSPRQAKRHEVRPGITGYAQVNGRNALSWEERFELDVWYVENHSLWLDLQIILATVGKVIKRSDVSSGTSVTMEEFKGSPTHPAP